MVYVCLIITSVYTSFPNHYIHNSRPTRSSILHQRCQILCRMTTIKMLGVTITNHLSFSDHGRDVISKMSRHDRPSVTASLQSSHHHQASVRITSLVGLATVAARQTARLGIYSTRSSTRTVPGWRPNDNTTYRQQRRQSLQQPTYQQTPHTQIAASWQDKLLIQSQKSLS